MKANCNKSLEACTKFNNLANFKGWHNLVPTKERLTKQFR
ncbi:MAG: phage BR0599 family protein [Waterburya sp.]